MTEISRPPTNTLIITNISQDLLEDPSPLINFLQENGYLTELVSLIKFERILVICESCLTAIKIYDLLRESPDWNYLDLTYSLKYNEFTPLTSDMLTALPNDKNYLELPSDVNSRRFLISPPLSPPPEWDHWDKVEEGPSQNPIYSPQELSHLLWERLGGYGSSDIRKYTDSSDTASNSIASESIDAKSEVLFRDIDNNVPAIILDTVKSCENNQPKSKPLAKTAFPPPLNE